MQDHSSNQTYIQAPKNEPVNLNMSSFDKNVNAQDADQNLDIVN